MSISSNIYHFHLMRTFKILSSSFFKVILSTFCIVLVLTTAQQNLFLPTCKIAQLASLSHASLVEALPKSCSHHPTLDFYSIHFFRFHIGLR